MRKSSVSLSLSLIYTHTHTHTQTHTNTHTYNTTYKNCFDKCQWQSCFTLLAKRLLARSIPALFCLPAHTAHTPVDQRTLKPRNGWRPGARPTKNGARGGGGRSMSRNKKGAARPGTKDTTSHAGSVNCPSHWPVTTTLYC